MPRGHYPTAYLREPTIGKPIDEIYQDLDAYTMEIFEDEASMHANIDVRVVLPPLYYDGVFLKGILMTAAADFLQRRHPQIFSLFHVVASSRWCSYPKSQSADAYLTLYPNPPREAWFRRQNPQRATKALIPMQEADFINEYEFAPVAATEKNIDVLCVAPLRPLKNIPHLAAALLVYSRKYTPRKLRMTLIAGTQFDVNFKGLSAAEMDELRMVERILVHPRDFIEMVPLVPAREMAAYYSRARVLVLGSLLEGKSHPLHEAMSCNTPLVCFEAYNQFARGSTPLFPPGAGLTAQFDPEALADALHAVVEHPEQFRPRRHYLQQAGRKRFLNRCIDHLPYYAATLPEYKSGDHANNIWLDLAVQEHYQTSLHDFLYDRKPHLSRAHGLSAADRCLSGFQSRFQHHSKLLV